MLDQAEIPDGVEAFARCVALHRKLTLDEFLPGQRLAVVVFAGKMFAEQAFIEAAIGSQLRLGTLLGQIAEEVR